MSTSSNPEMLLLRHTLATLAYRAAKTLRDAPEDVAGLKAGPSTRTPVEILAHMGDLLDWGLSIADCGHAWHDSKPLPWSEEVERFFTALRALDRRLSEEKPLGAPPEKIFQGPIADALTHVGQIALLRRLGHAPVRGENYFRAKIEAGRVGADQALPEREFD